MHRALFLAAHAGVRIQIVHVSSPVSAELVAPREGRAASAASMEICPHHLLLDLDDLVRLGPYGCCAPALRERALVERLWELRARRHRRLPGLRPRGLHAGGEGAGLGRHLRAPARLPGDPGDGADGARRGLPPPRHGARRVRALLLDERRAHRRPLPAQGHDPARRRRRHRAVRPRREWTVDAAEPAVLQEPVVAVRRPPRAGALRAHARARRDRVPRRRDPRRARATGGSCPARTTTPGWPRGPHGELPAGAGQPQHRRRRTPTAMAASPATCCPTPRSCRCSPSAAPRRSRATPTRRSPPPRSSGRAGDIRPRRLPDRAASATPASTPRAS